VAFNDIPIRRKLTLVIMLTSSSVLLLAGLALIAYEFTAYKKNLLESVRSIAEITAESSTAALGFRDEKYAYQALYSLRLENHIRQACLYDNNGRIFARYPYNSRGFPTRVPKEGSRIENNDIIFVLPVLEPGKLRQGTLYIRSDLTPVYERISLYGAVVLLILLGSFLLTVAVAAFFQKRISQPILALAQAAQIVSANKNYSIRAPKMTGDELGMLTDAFNDMLAQIHQRDVALGDKEARLRLALQASHTGTWDWKVATNEVLWDDQLHRLFGLAPGSFPGTFEAFASLVYVEDRRLFEDAMTRALKEKTEFSAEYRVVWPDGSMHYLVSRGAAIYDEQQQPIRMTGVALDGTKSKLAEEEIRRLNADLEQRVATRTAELTAINKELEAFTYSVAHDLRAPLRHIDGYVQILQQEFADQLPPQAQAYTDRIQQGAQNMGQLVDDLLNLARVGRQEIDRQVTALQPIVNEVIANFRSETEKRDIEWRVGELPFVECDPGLMRQVFANLISNAIKYTRPRAHPAIEIGQTQVNDSTVIYVRDNGVGFSMKYASKLFGVFQRLHRAEDFEGTGVGLATVDRIIRKHGGQVWAEAELDKGATFFFVVDKSQAAAQWTEPKSNNGHS
jgi:PAS domain S-box-containing protein